MSNLRFITKWRLIYVNVMLYEWGEVWGLEPIILAIAVKKIKVETERQVFLSTLSIYLRACEKPILVMVEVFWPEEESSAYTVIWSHYYNMTKLKKKKKQTERKHVFPKDLELCISFIQRSLVGHSTQNPDCAPCLLFITPTHLFICKGFLLLGIFLPMLLAVSVCL